MAHGVIVVLGFEYEYRATIHHFHALFNRQKQTVSEEASKFCGHDSFSNESFLSHEYTSFVLRFFCDQLSTCNGQNHGSNRDKRYYGVTVTL